MTTRIIVKAHRHGVTTRVWVGKTRNSYVEYCIAGVLFPSLAIASTDSYELEKLASDTLHFEGETFDAFPYPAYLEVDFTFTNQANHAEALCVSSAKYVDNQKGMLDFTSVFRGSLVSADVKRKILQNIFYQIGERNVEEIQKIVKNLRTACAGSYAKIY